MDISDKAKSLCALFTKHLKIVAFNTTMIVSVVLAGNSSHAAGGIPAGFVYLRDVDPSIVQDMRYAGSHNFVGRQVKGYKSADCILTREAAEALKQVQAGLSPKGLSLIVWDCYRPARAVLDFLDWLKAAGDGRMKAEFYPRTEQSRLFALGYIARRSHHSRGSTVDLAIVPAALKEAPEYHPEARLTPCYAPKGERFEDGTLDFGTGQDCLDVTASFSNTEVGKVAKDNRALLRNAMVAAGFRPYEKEWWHFELKNEPFNTEFDFEVTPEQPR
jgi:zinc D-Ala-D-Ala dipeptidase